MSNPWELINLNDYENHMSLNSVYQLQTLNEMMKKQFNSYDVTSAMVLGVAGGNGIEHITKEKFQKVYGVDVNKTFLTECQNRFKNLEGVFETICADLSEKNLILPNAEFLIANLLIEYIGYECFQNIVKTVKPKYVSCVIQLNTDTSFVSDSPYIHTFDCLEEVHHQMEEMELINYMQMIGYKLIIIEEQQLPNGKKFLKIDFINKETKVSNETEVTTMLRLRPYKPCDAETIAGWIKDEVSFRKWCSDRFENFPITAEDINRKYINYNGDCVEEDNFYPMTAFDETGIVGHLILRFTDAEKKTIRFGFVIVDDSKRGKGYGKEMLKLAQQFAFSILKAERITLGVFDNNPSAYYCYKAAGFQDVQMDKEIICTILGEQWKILELEVTYES